MALAEALRVGLGDPLTERLQDRGVVRILLLLGEAQTTGPLDLILGIEVHGEAVRLDQVEELPARGLFLQIRMRLVERVLVFYRKAINGEQRWSPDAGPADLLDFTALSHVLQCSDGCNTIEVVIRCT